MNRRISFVEFRHEIRIVAYMKTKTNKIMMKMNSRIKTKKQTAIIAVTIMAALSAAMIIGIDGQNLQNANAQTYQPGIIEYCIISNKRYCIQDSQPKPIN